MIDMICKICSNKTIEFAQATVLKKYQVRYFSCENCGFVQTNRPYSIEEAYIKAINDFDLGLLQRNINLSKFTSVVIRFLLHLNGKFLDYGGGYGTLVRLMRDQGYDFYRYDSMCQNIFANGFDWENSASSQYSLVTAFEVFEHFEEPLLEVENMLRFSNHILISTALLPKSPTSPQDWSYYGLDHGQHISFYTKASFEYLAKKYKLKFYTNGYNLHLLSSKIYPAIYFKLLSKYKVFSALSLLTKGTSLLSQDYFKITGCKLM